RLREPMAPVDAALEQGGRSTVDTLPTLEEHVGRINELAQTHETILVEGAGGLLVKLTSAGETIADLAHEVCGKLVVVTRPDLGTLNHTALTLEAAIGRGFVHGALVLGSFPVSPTPVHTRNRENLRALAEHHGWIWAEGLPAGLGSVDTNTSDNGDLRKASRKLNHVLVELASGR
ncbi:MAG: dethiobiotin synthase, partial [Micrococcaceae bacterium]|nr:dethiobiotin synthase [Micrococcaceae bacterium]